MLTEAGRDFRQGLWALLSWGNRHFAPEGASVMIVDGESGAVADPVLMDRATLRPLTRPPSAPPPAPPPMMSCGGDMAHFPKPAVLEASMSDAITRRDVAPGAIAADRGRSRLRPRHLLLAGAALAILAGAGWYGRSWWTTGRFIQTTDNARVHAGDLLIRIDPRDYQAGLAHDEAVLAARTAAAVGLRAQRDLQNATIRQQEADLAARAAHAAFTVQDAQRYASLAATSAGSRQEAERSASLDREARSAVAESAAALDAARQKLNVLDSGIEEADAAVAQARADLQTARLDLGYTEIRAPIDGIVGNRAAQISTYVKSGAYLISVTPAAGLWVDANFKEDQLSRMMPGQVADIVADVLPGHVFHGHLASFMPGTGAVFSVIPPENATGNFIKIVRRVPVRVVLDGDNEDLPMLRPGLSTMIGVDTRNAPR